MADAIAVSRATEMLARMRGRRVVVIGDVMIDEWIWGDVARISPEAPVPVVAVHEHTFTLGGAANVVNNLEALDARATIVGCVGDDPQAQTMADLFAELGVEAELLPIAGRPTTRKTRIVARGQQVVRADWESTAALPAADRARLLERFVPLVAHADAVIISDYAKGIVQRDIVDAALAAPIVVADPKPANIALLRGVTCIAPNAAEASRASGIGIVDDASLARAGAALLEMLQCRYVLVTRGEHGMSLFAADGDRFDVPAVARTVFDVSGAGDTVVAVLTLALAAGIPATAATQLANFAAGAVVEKLGTATATPDEIIALMNDADGR